MAKKPKKPEAAPTAPEKPSITVHQMNPDAMEEAKRVAAEQKRIADETRDYVLPRHRQLIGCTIPVEILSIQNIPGHSCLIINDLLLFSYVEAKELLEQLEDQG